MKKCMDITNWIENIDNLLKMLLMKLGHITGFYDDEFFASHKLLVTSH